jgi:hypothetical protein
VDRTAKRSRPGPAAGRAPSLHGERGLAIIWAVASLFLISSMVVASAHHMRAADESVSIRFAVEGQARQVAESGLVDALSWFRQRTTQPVTVFDPERDLAADPPVDETDDPASGMVRQFEIAPGVWGRYTVRIGTPAEPFSDANGNGLYDDGERFDDLDGNGVRTPAQGTRDISDRRKDAVAGAVWYLESEGEIFRRSRMDLELGEGPNTRLAVRRVASEIRRVTTSLPALSALVASRGKDVKLKDEARVVAPGTGITYAKGTGSPDVDKKAKIVAPTPTAAVAGWGAYGSVDASGSPTITVEAIFGQDWTTLRTMADVAIGWDDKTAWQKPWKKNRLPYTIPDDGMVVVTADKKGLKKVEFDKKYPLRGRGMVLIDGDMSIKKDSGSEFEGILFVDGDLKIEGPVTIKGTVIVTGKVELKGKRGDVEIVHDPAIITRLLGHTDQYRRSKATFLPSWVGSDETPYESSPTQPGGPPPGKGGGKGSGGSGSSGSGSNGSGSNGSGGGKGSSSAGTGP